MKKRNKNGRRMLSLLLVLALLLGTPYFSVAAAAADGEGNGEALEQTIPLENMEEPSNGTEDPSEGTEEPGAGTEDPSEGTEEPGAGTEDPSEGTEEPGAGTEDPSEGTEEPGEGTEDPTENTEEPGEGTEDPTENTEEPPEDPDDLPVIQKSMGLRQIRQLLGNRSGDIEFEDIPTPYLELDGVSYRHMDCIIVKSDATSWGADGYESWYVVNEGVEVLERITVHGAVNLILADSMTLNANNGGIAVNTGNSLTIYAQSDGADMGTLQATGGGSQAGIGGDNHASGGTITINGGVITATSGNGGAGIGGGDTGAGGHITINGGSVTAAAATSTNDYGAGIGGGAWGQGGTINITGGSVTATSAGKGAGIGGGGASSDTKNGGAGTVTITGGTVNASSTSGAGIGGAGTNTNGTLILDWAADAATSGLPRITSSSYQLLPENVTYQTAGHSFASESIPYRELREAEIVTLTSPSTIYPTASAVPYLDADGVRQLCTYYSLVSNTTTALTTGWWVVEGDVTVSSRIICTGDVHLILADGATLTAKCGIEVQYTEALTLYAQSTDEDTMGKLIASKTDDVSEGTIGGKQISSTVTSENYDNTLWGMYINSCGTITINGGYISAYANKSGAAIGGAYCGFGGTITINNGIVYATQTGQASAIGGGYRASGGNIQINGGTVTAESKKTGAAIGGGACHMQSVRYNAGSGGTITITGGTVTASSNSAAAIGGGYNTYRASQGGGAGTITITGGTVNASSTSGAGIGGAGSNQTGTLILDWAADAAGLPRITSSGYQLQNGTVTYQTAGHTFALSTDPEVALSTAEIKALTGTTTIIPTATVPYVDADGTTRRCADYNVVTNSTTALTDGWWVVNTNTTVSNRITCTGDVRLILADGATLTASAGVTVNGANALTVYGQTGQTGTLAAATTDHLIAPLGGDGTTTAGAITINGGVVTADNDNEEAGAPGIGNRGQISSITINRGAVTATGSAESAGIGATVSSPDGVITINGGTVTAHGYNGGTGIGGGASAYVGHININGGTVTADTTVMEGAQEDEIGVAIGTIDESGGSSMGGSTPLSGGITAYIGTITFNDDDTVTVDIDMPENLTSYGGPGIGAGRLSTEFGEIRITGGTVSAAGSGGDGSKGAGIGGCGDAVNGTVVITGGDITATSTDFVGIGSKDAAGVSVSISGGTVRGTGAAGKGIAAGTLTLDWAGGSPNGEPRVITTGYQVTTVVYGTSGHPFTLASADAALTESQIAALSVSNTIIPYGGVPYLDVGDVTEGHAAYYNVVTDTTTALTDGWWVVEGNVTVSSRIICTGDVHLILADGATLNANRGIGVNTGNSLTVYAQSDGEDRGTLIATVPATNATKNNAGIGGTDNVCGSVTINGGAVTATGGSYSGYGGAGIGSGGNRAGGIVIINGGSVTATGNGGAAGIGGGFRGAGGTVTVNGGTVTATGGDYGGAGIGGGGGAGGNGGAGGTVTITGGTVTATGGAVSGTDVLSGAGIGGGRGNSNANGGAGGTIKITGGRITAVGGKNDADAYAAGIGGGGTNTNGTLILDWADEDPTTGLLRITASSYNVNTVTYQTAAHTFALSTAPTAALTVAQIKALDTRSTIFPVLSAVPYLDANGEIQSCTEYSIVTDTTTALTAGWWVVNADTEVSSRIICTGDVHLILCDGTTLNAELGIGVNAGNSLTIYAQTSEKDDPDGTVMGKLSVANNQQAAGVGGDNHTDAGTITINGGKITATTSGSYAGTGIGGGNVGSGGTIIINDGIVTATCTYGGAAGIGGGNSRGGGRITINGGKVDGTGKGKGAGIGGGWSASGGTITITGGTVNGASGSGAGIGGGLNASGGTITITGGTVTADGTIGGGGTNTDGAIHLGWTRDTYETTSIYADSYQGTVSFDRCYVLQSSPSTRAAASPNNINGVTIIPGAVCTPYFAEGRYYKVGTAFDGGQTTISVPVNSGWTAKVDIGGVIPLVDEMRISFSEALPTNTLFTLTAIEQDGTCRYYYAVLPAANTMLTLSMFMSIQDRVTRFAPVLTDETYLLSADFSAASVGTVSDVGITYTVLCRNGGVDREFNVSDVSTYSLTALGAVTATDTAVTVTSQPSGSALLVGKKVYLVATVSAAAEPDLRSAVLTVGNIDGTWISNDIAAFELGDYGTLSSLVGAAQSVAFRFYEAAPQSYTVTWTLCVGDDVWNIRGDPVSNSVTTGLASEAPSLAVTRAVVRRLVEGGESVTFTVTADRAYKVQLEKQTGLGTYAAADGFVTQSHAASDTSVSVTIPGTAGTYCVCFSMDDSSTNDNVYYTCYVSPS